MRHNKLRNLLNANKDRPRDYRVKAEGDEATIYLYDAIDSWYGIAAEQFVKDLNGITASVIHLRINSPGGDVFDARAMAGAIAAHNAKVIAHIDGLAASAATYIATAADEVEISQGAFFMIHNAWTLAMGNKGELRDVADLLEKVDDSLANDYVRKTGKPRDEIVAWMDAETWFTADEAVENGFADRVVEAKKASNRWDLSAYAKPPKALIEPETQIHDRAALERRLSMLAATAA